MKLHPPGSAAQSEGMVGVMGIFCQNHRSGRQGQHGLGMAGVGLEYLGQSIEQGI